MKMIYFPRLLALVAVLSFSQQVKAQPGIFKELLIDDGAGHKVHIAPPSGLTNSSPIDWTLPLPGVGNPTPGFVQAGDATNNALQWDNTNKYWKAVTASGGASLSGGTTNAITKWSSATTVTTSSITDNGSVVTVTAPSFVSTSTANGIQETPVHGTGSRMMWLPSIPAFRAGSITGTSPLSWDDLSVGINSTAFGQNTTASGTYSFAAGNSTQATGDAATAFGENTTASGIYSFAAGSRAQATGNAATAFGLVTAASGIQSFASGNNTTASGNNSVAIGSFVSTNGKSGSFIYGDASTIFPTNNTADNQFTVRATGGTNFITTANGTTPDVSFTNGTMRVTGGVHYGVRSVSANYTATSDDYVILADATLGAITVTLPAASNKGQVIVMTKTDVGPSLVTAAAGTGDRLRSSTGVSASALASGVTFVADGATTWYVIAHQ